jgi:phage N-6-adenine-methyltransferase
MYQAHPTPSPDDEETGWTRDDWNTPPWVLAPLYAFAGGEFALDPCSNATSLVAAELALTKEDDALSCEWDVDGLIFVNPPYSKGLYLAFAQKAVEQAEKGREIVLLVPTNCETEAWTDNFWGADAVCFIDKRVRFLKDGEAKGSPAGGSALVYFGPRPLAFGAAVEGLGFTVYPGAMPEARS